MACQKPSSEVMAEGTCSEVDCPLATVAVGMGWDGGGGVLCQVDPRLVSSSGIAKQAKRTFLTL